MKKSLAFLIASFPVSLLALPPSVNPLLLDVPHLTWHAFDTPYSIAISGYIRHVSFADTRQVVSANDGLYSFFPRRKVFDHCGRDINSKGCFNMLAISSRVHTELFGPLTQNSTIRGTVEVDFLGPFAPIFLPPGEEPLTNIQLDLLDTVDGARLRYAYITIDTPPISFLLGQYWSPAFVPDCFAHTVSYNSGGPMEAFSQVTQLRITGKFKDKMELIFAAAEQINDLSTGPLGRTSLYLRRSMVPNMHLQFRYFSKYNLFGFGIDFLRLIPRLRTNKNIRHAEHINSIRWIAYASLKTGSLRSNIKFMLNQNPADFEIIGGYAVHSVDPVTDTRTYTNLRNVIFWGDFTIENYIEPGLFIGGLKNLGSRKTIIKELPNALGFPESTVYALAPDIDHIWRIAPRVRWYKKPLILGAELEYTRASFGTLTSRGTVTNATPVANLRLITSFNYVF